MTTIHSQITKREEIHVPKGFSEAPTDAQRAPVKNVDGSLSWVRTDSFVGTPGPAGPSIQTISVANIASPVELKTIDGTFGSQVMAIQFIAGDENKVGFYQWDASGNVANENIPFVISGLGNAGDWLLVSGFVNQWIENATGATTIVRGGVITINAIDNTKVDISETVCMFFDNYSDPENNNTYLKAFAAQTDVDVLNLATADATIFSYDRDGNLIRSNTLPTAAQRREFCRIGYAWHPDGILVQAGSLPQNNYAVGSTVFDLYTIIGPQNVTGNIYSANGANLNIDKSLGQTFSMGANWSADKKNPNFNTDAGFSPTTFSSVWKSSATDWTITRNLLAIDPNNYNDGITLTAVPAGEFTIQRVFWGSVLSSTMILFGNTVYPDYDTAVSRINDPFEVPENFASLGMVYRCALIIQQGTTDIEAAVTAGSCSFVNINPRFQGSTSSGSTSIATLQSAYDASIDGTILTTQAKGALKLQAETNLVPTLLEVRDETASLKFSVSRAGVITGAVATAGVQGLMSSLDKTKLDGIQAGAEVNPTSTTSLPEGTNLYYTEARVSANTSVAANTAKKTNLEAWMQYSNAAQLTTASVVTITINQNEDSFPNGLLTAFSSSQIRTLFDGYVEIFYSVEATASGNDGHFQIELFKNGATITPALSAASTGRGTLSAMASNKMIVACAINDNFSINLTPQSALTYTVNARNAKLCVRAIRIN